MTGFFEESQGVRSMARLTVAWMSVLATMIVGTTCYCIVRGKLDAAAIVALGGMLLTVIAKGAVAIVNRNAPADDK